MSISEKIKNEIVPQFLYNGTFIYEEPFGCGHINSTFAVYFSRETKPPVRYILQAINTSIFKDPYGLMENIEGVTSHLRKKLIEQGKDPSRGTLTVIPTKSGSSLFKDSEGVYWRSYTLLKMQPAIRPFLLLKSSKMPQKRLDIFRNCLPTIQLTPCMKSSQISITLHPAMKILKRP